MLKNCASNRSPIRSFSLIVLNTLLSKRAWNGPRYAFRAAPANAVSEKSHAAVGEALSVVGPQGGTPLVPGALISTPNSAPFSTGFVGFTPVVPCNFVPATVPPGMPSNGLVIKLSAEKYWLPTVPEKSTTLYGRPLSAVVIPEIPQPFATYFRNPDDFVRSGTLYT